RRRDVVVPQVMMDCLEAPDEFARLRAKRHHRVGEAVVAGTFAAVVVRAGAAGRNEDQLARGVCNNYGPRIGGPGAMRASAFPAIEARLVRGLGNRVP